MPSLELWPCRPASCVQSQDLSLQDAWSDQKGQIHLDSQQDYQLLQAQRTPEGLVLLFKRPFGTCDPKDYLIEVSRSPEGPAQEVMGWGEPSHILGQQPWPVMYREKAKEGSQAAGGHEGLERQALPAASDSSQDPLG